MSGWSRPCWWISALALLLARERADELSDRVARDDARQRERHERDAEQHGDEQDEPSYCVGQHRSVT